MANRDAKLIERTLKDFSLGALNGNGGGSSSLYTYYVEAMDTGQFTYYFTFQCDGQGLDSYDKLLQYLLSKGYYIRNYEEPSRTPILGVFSNYSLRRALINGLFVAKNFQEKLTIEGNIIYVSSGQLYTDSVSLKSDNFKITLVTE